MARVTFINSILSGKLAGMVFANNKSGEYVRQYRKGTDPATSAQLNNRASFIAASTSWHALTDAKKAVWNSFAVTDFKPKNGSSGVRFSGFNAFVSINNVVNNMIAKDNGSEIILPVGITNTNLVFSNIQDAPTHPLSAMIRTSTNLPMQIIFNTFELTGASGNWEATFDLIGPTGPGPITAAPLFKDAIGNVDVGIAIVASLPIEQNQQFVSNPELNLVAVINPPGALTGWTTGNSIKFQGTAAPDYAGRKLGYETDDLVQFKAYIVSINGMTMPLNAVKSTVL